MDVLKQRENFCFNVLSIEKHLSKESSFVSISRTLRNTEEELLPHCLKYCVTTKQMENFLSIFSGLGKAEIRGELLFQYLQVWEALK